MDQIIVVTPAGQIKVRSISEANEYKRQYGYPYVIREVLRPIKK